MVGLITMSKTTWPAEASSFAIAAMTVTFPGATVEAKLLKGIIKAEWDLVVLINLNNNGLFSVSRGVVLLLPVSIIFGFQNLFHWRRVSGVVREASVHIFQRVSFIWVPIFVPIPFFVLFSPLALR